MKGVFWLYEMVLLSKRFAVSVLQGGMKKQEVEMNLQMITDFMTSKEKNKGGKSDNDAFVISTPFSDIHCTVHYPEENPKTAVQSITDALHHIGVFEGIQ